jgi:hypothetical protein
LGFIARQWKIFLCGIFSWGHCAKNRRRSSEVMMPLMFQLTFVSEFLIQIATQQSSYMRETLKGIRLLEVFTVHLKKYIFVILSFFVLAG